MNGNIYFMYEALV